MLEVMREPEATPTIALAEALEPSRRDLPTLKFGLVLRMLPRPEYGDRQATADAWYDLRWSVPALCQHPDDPRPGCYIPAEPLDPESYAHVDWHDIASVGTLPPPAIIPAADRLAALPAAIRDWAGFVTEVVLPRYRSLTPPKVSPADRLWPAGARIWRAAQELENARTSAATLLRNAAAPIISAGGRPPKTEWTARLGVSRPTVNAWLTPHAQHNDD